MSRHAPSPWLRHPRPRPEAELRLICLPHAGGAAAAFRPWAPLLPAGVDLLCVQPPGREDRFHEDPVEAMADYAGPVAAALAPLLDRPYVLFGHSMGSAVAVELAHRLRGAGHGEPVRLFASGRRAPHRAAPGAVHRSPDASILAELDRLGGTDPEVLAEPGLREAVLRCVRADYRLIETHAPDPGARLECPVTLFIGEDDPEVAEEDAAGWAETTRGGVETRVFPGDHFYLAPHRRDVVAALLRRLDPALAAAAAPWPSTP
ncbi:alpha/beta fold hydrolase [Rothia sp. AR01]|uniref:Alpha/beta fold hydrolase n=1 Tax=Rothia santali TaxID=2949643 RepID=A0A9X2HI25_9MICC|nr:alpha/beta fold hydrolase [Rothia santali]MCP3424663.1 alpha/beta fold hydrolase [Rothia santali]